MRFAHLTRNIYNMINSRREFDASLQAHAKKMAKTGRFVNSKIANLETDSVAITQPNYDDLENQSAEIGALIDCPAIAVDKAISEKF